MGKAKLIAVAAIAMTLAGPAHGQGFLEKLDKAIADIFLYLGREEAAIGENPAKRTTELLKKVFAK